MNIPLIPSAIKIPHRMGYSLPKGEAFNPLALEEAIRQNIRYIDVTDPLTASFVGGLPKDLCEELFLSVRIGWSEDGSEWLSIPKMEELIQDTLARLKRTNVDAVLFDSPPLEAIVGKTPHAAWLESLKATHKTRLIGVRVHQYADLKLVLEKRPVDLIQLKFHVFDQSCAPLFVFIKAKKQLLIVESPLDDGWLVGNHAESVHTGMASQSTKPSVPERKAIYIERLKTILKTDSLTIPLLSFVYSHDAVGVVLPPLKTAAQFHESLAASMTTLTLRQKSDLIDFYASQIKNQPF